MSRSTRVNLYFNDTPDEKFALSVLEQKGRSKTAYITECIIAREKRTRLEEIVSPGILTVLENMLVGRSDANIEAVVNEAVKLSSKQDDKCSEAPRPAPISDSPVKPNDASQDSALPSYIEPDFVSDTDKTDIDESWRDAVFDALSAFDNTEN